MMRMLHPAASGLAVTGLALLSVVNPVPAHALIGQPPAAAEQPPHGLNGDSASDSTEVMRVSHA